MLGDSQPTQSPRVALHVKTTRTQTQDGAGGFPASHGRRLMQMIFRSNNECEPKESMHAAMVLASPVAIHVDARSENDEVPVGSNKLGALKRKLFPSRKRRHPARIPPLVVSPIHAGVTDTHVGGNNRADGSDEPDSTDPLVVTEGREKPVEDELEAGCEECDDHDFDDDLLEAIEEADRLRSTTSDETLAQMSRTIDELYQWKAQQELAMQSALKSMEERDAQEAVESAATEQDEACEAALLEEVEHTRRFAEAARMKMMLTLRETEASMAAHSNGNQQVAQILLDAEREAAKEIDASSRLRAEVFDLGVKELSSKLQASWLQELGGAQDELDMKLFDVQAFASDLDSVLAQFDAVGSGHAEQSSAGQMPQEN